MQTARDIARTNLARYFKYQYCELYIEEKGDKTGSKQNSLARSRAINRLVHYYPRHYQLLYERAIDEGYPRSRNQGTENTVR